MVKLKKQPSAEQNIVKEFVPANKEIAHSMGRIIVRAYNYGSRLSKFDELFKVMAEDALTFQPPIELDRDDVEIIHYGGRCYAKTFGLEVSIPQEHIVPDEYRRVPTIEYSL